MLAEAVIQNMSWYPHTILVLSGVVLSSDGITGDGKVYADDYSHLVFSLPAKFLVKCEVGMKIKFKANWTKKGATYEITEVLLVEPKKVAIEQLEVLSKEDVKPEAGPATSKFYFRVQASQSSLNPTIFEAGSFGIIEDRDFKIGLIKAVKPSVRRGVGGYNTLEIICVEDLSPSRLTYLKVVQKCEKGQTLEMVVNEAQSNQSEKENSYTWPPMPGRLNQSHCYRNNSFSDCSQPSPSFALQESEDNALTLGGNHQY
uniref:Uncharacterized protein n=1 Tax=Acrobeloides nanus TaxID=290746 RepID=A0A914EGM3_9BILA